MGGRKMKIGVVGLGKIGLPLALVFSQRFKVCGVDLNKERIKSIVEHRRFLEPQVNEYLDRYKDNLEFSTSYEILRDCDVNFVITQTPSLPDGKFDLKYVKSAVENLHKVNPECLAVVSSTINIGDIDALRIIHGRIVYNPEFIRQGSIIHDFNNPKFVVIGAYSKRDGEIVAGIWRKIHNKPIYIVKPVEAEIIKIGLNFSFTLAISFANAMGEICERFNADSNVVLDIMYKDRRNYKPGLGYAGPCFPRDVKCFKQICNEHGLELGRILSSTVSVMNDIVVQKHLEKIKKHKKKRIGILGVAYKPNVPYIYESQPIKIAQELLNQNYKVYIYDALAEEAAKEVLHGEVYFCPTPRECIEKSDVIFIGTPNHKDLKTDKPIISPW
ncbi:MAG TPA: nucleotide sugar dehydrogenase [Archaeoglobus sp.]|nr:nucleotide sugar dehydrogenase [Archaeoglobus sp.]